MKKTKIKIIIIVLIIILIFISNLDKKLRYNIGLIDYYKYNAKLMDDEFKLINEKSFLVGVYNYPPLAYTNEFNNSNIGIMIDYLSQLTIELTGNMHTKVGLYGDLLDSLERDELDIVVVENIKGEEFEEEFKITQPLCIVKSKVLVKKNSGVEKIKDLRDKKLVTLKKNNVDGNVESFFQGINNIEIIEVENIYQCFALLSNNLVEGFVGDDMAVAHFLNVTNKSADFKFLKPVLSEKEISLAVKNHNDNLLSILNKGILQIKKKNLIAQTQYKWLGNFDIYGIDLKSIEGAYKIIVIIIIIVGAFSSWNYIITQRVNLKTKELSESKEELRLIIETMKNGIMVIENDSIIVECNDSIVNMIGVSKECLIGSAYKNIKKLSYFLDENNMDRILNIGSFYYYITKQKMPYNKSMIIVEDYTEKYLEEKRERQESKMIAVGQLSAGLAHEIRNPLGLIKNYSYIIEKHKLNEICNHAILVINDSVDRINNLIENLLRFSKLSNDETKLVDIEILIDSIIDGEKINIKEKGIEITSCFTNGHTKNILVNVGVLRMVLINLINNSVDSFAGISKEDKSIHLEVDVKKEKLYLRVSDNGIGIEKAKLDNIFDPFFSTKESGTGLGLYIISTEITNNNGQISVESTLGEGTTFDIVLPIME